MGQYTQNDRAVKRGISQGVIFRTMAMWWAAHMQVKTMRGLPVVTVRGLRALTEIPLLKECGIQSVQTGGILLSTLNIQLKLQ